MDETTELPTSHELEKNSPPIRIIFQRHGEPDRTRPKVDDPKDVKEKAGWLTTSGIEKTKEIAKQKATQILTEAKASGHPVTFYFLNSPSAWYGEEGIAYGIRAEQTAQINAQIVNETIEELGLTPQQARVHLFGKSVEGTRPHEKLTEPNRYFVDGSQNPRAYNQALIEKYGAENAEEGYHEISADLEEVRKRSGAKNSAEEGQEVIDLIKALDRYGRRYRTSPNEQQVFWLDSHGDKERSLLQHGLGVGDEVKGYVFAPSELMEMDLDQGRLSTSFKDKNYQLDLN